MVAKEIRKRNDRAQRLRVIGVDDEIFYVESSEGKICYSFCARQTIPLKMKYYSLYGRV